MPKPKTKTELLSQSQDCYNALQLLLDSYSEEKLKSEFSTNTLNRNVRDVLAHLHQWHLMFLDWYKVGMNGENPHMPAKGYTWKTLPALNSKIWQDSQEIELQLIKKKLDTSYQKVLKITKKHSDEELFTKKKYKWTGSTSLGAYLISNSYSHYNWAIKLIKKGLK